MLPIVTLSINPSIDIVARTERVTPGQQCLCNSAEYLPGGGSINISRVLRRMEIPTLAVHTAGGVNGMRLEALLDNEGIDHRSIPIRDETRQRFMASASDSGEDYRFSLPGPRLEPDELQAFLAAAGSAAEETQYMVARGTLPDGAPPDTYALITEAVHSGGARLVLDGSQSDLMRTLERARIDLLICDSEGIAKSGGRALEWPSEQAAWAEKQVRQRCARAVVLTHADDGVLMITRDDRVRLQAPVNAGECKVDIAGDSFLGGVCAGLGEARPLVETCALGVAASAAAGYGYHGPDTCATIRQLYRDVDISSF